MIIVVINQFIQSYCTCLHEKVMMNIQPNDMAIILVESMDVLQYFSERIISFG